MDQADLDEITSLEQRIKEQAAEIAALREKNEQQAAEIATLREQVRQSAEVLQKLRYEMRPPQVQWYYDWLDRPAIRRALGEEIVRECPPTLEEER